MSRCSICDYSQSADSLYHNSLSFSHHPMNNRVVYSPELRKDICISCLEEYMQQQNYWASLLEDGYAFEDDTEQASDYCGCTEVKAD